MKFITRQYEIGEEISPPPDAVNPTVRVAQTDQVNIYPGLEGEGVERVERGGNRPVAILTYIELTPEEMRELKLQQMQQRQVVMPGGQQ